MVVVYVLLAAGFVLVVQAHTASAQVTRTDLVVGLQEDMTSLNFFDPASNSVWKAYQIQWNFETLLGRDPSYQLFAWLADPNKGTTGPGFTADASGLNVTVYLRSGITFTDGTPLTADDVVFTYQTLAWGTPQTSISQAIWWDAPKEPLWNATTCTPKAGMPYGCMSHVGVKKIDTTTVLFQLAVPYALFYQDTLVNVPIIPEHIWASHLQSTPQLNLSSIPNDITDTWDQSISFGFGGKSTDIAATVGSGMLKLISWSPKQGSVETVYTNYWGKNVYHPWNGVNYYFYPHYGLQTIRFIIYSSLDVASLSLQSGEIDTLVWPLTGGFLTQVQYNPAISVQQVTDDGFYYLAFNMRKSPWNDLALRYAISEAVDKDYIVKTLLGGFGAAGTVPVSVTNPAYVNTTAAPPSFNLLDAANRLELAGYHIDPATGFRTTPTGAPIVSSILTPPKDYDPVRADAGIMISNNLKSIGLDIDSAPTDFNAIVAKAFSPPVAFDMYVLGWVQLDGFPETYLCNFFCGGQDVNINPAGSNSPGYHNDAFDALMKKASVTLDDTARQKMFWDAEGMLTHDLPYDTLYYRKNLNAYRNDAWVGWVNTPPDIFNFWSLVNLRPAGAVTIPPSTGTLSIAATVPQKALADHALTTDVFVAQGSAPANGAKVWINGSLASGLQLFSASGTTDVSGHASIAWTTPTIQGTLILQFAASLGSATATSTKQLEIIVGPPAPMALLSLSTTTPVIHAGGTATITASLIDGVGQPIANQKVTIDTTLLQGTISPSNTTTDSTGHATFTYSAPANTKKFPNAHRIDTVRATVSVSNTIVGDTQTATLSMFIQNDDPPVWTIASIQGTPRLVLSPVTPSTTITVKVTNYAGTAMSGVDVLTVTSWDAGKNITIAPASAGSNKTDAGGLASFTVTETAVAQAARNVTNIPLRFLPANQLFNVSDEAELLVTDGLTPGYAAQIMFFKGRTDNYAAVPTQENVTALVYDQLGLPAVGAQVIFRFGYGDLGIPAEFQWSYDYATGTYLGHGLDVNQFGIGSLGGSFANSHNETGTNAQYGVENFVEDLEVVGNFGSIDSCDPTTWPTGFNGLYFLNSTSLTGTNGMVSANWTAVQAVHDVGIPLIAYIGAPGANLQVTMDACNFVGSIDNAAFAIDSGVVTQRAPVIGLGSISTSLPVFTSANLTMTATATFYTLNGVAANTQVFITHNDGRAMRNVLGKYGGPLTTNAAGQVSQTISAVLASLSQPFTFHYLPADSRYAYGTRQQLFVGALGDYWSSPLDTCLVAKFPFDWVRGYLFIPSSVGFATASVSKTLVLPGSIVQATIHVETGNGTKIDGAAVWSGPVQTTTDASGNALVNFTAGVGASEGLAVVTTPDGQVMRAWFGVMASGPVVTYGSITQNVGSAGSASTFSLTVTNTLPIAGPVTVTMMVGTNTVAAQVVNMTASGTATVTFQYVFTNSGTYTVTIGTQSVQATVGAAPPTGIEAITAYALAGGLLVVGIVVGVFVGMMLARRRKQPPTSAPEEPAEGEKPAEEELGPGDQL